jgi:hypothetical protein
MTFAENASFKSSGVIYWSPPPSSLPGELSMDKRDSNGFISTRRVYVWLIIDPSRRLVHH